MLFSYEAAFSQRQPLSGSSSSTLWVLIEQFYKKKKKKRIYFWWLPISKSLLSEKIMEFYQLIPSEDFEFLFQ